MQGRRQSNNHHKCSTFCCLPIGTHKKNRSTNSMATLGVQLHVEGKYVIIDNGIIQLKLSNPEGMIVSIAYNGLDNLLEPLNKEDNRGYWDLVWGELKGPGIFDVVKGTSFTVIKDATEQVEVSFTRTFDPSLNGKMVPLNIDKRFIVLQGSSGFYSYAIYEHLEQWPSFYMAETRVAFKLRKEKFHYMALSDTRQRIMPMPEDRIRPRGMPLAFPEAVLLIDPINNNLQGEVDDKYQYSIENADNKVHGWMSLNPPIGFWQITPSDEFRTGGPMKQNLTSHVGPTTLSVFASAHYAGDDLVPKFRENEYWKKVFGPVFVYINSASGDAGLEELWEDAKTQMVIEIQSWPYDFPVSVDFPASEKRGSVTGILLVNDWYVDEELILADSAYVGLALPGSAGSWQRECKGYQFWTRTDSTGRFCINNVRTGTYNLYAFISGFIGDYQYESPIEINEGCQIELGVLVYVPPRHGPTLWEIGIPDRSAFEFFIPDPNPSYVNKLYVNHPERFRQYGLWERYAELYPDNDLIYTVGTSCYWTDWFFVQVTRKIGENMYVSTTWQVRFQLNNVMECGTYKLRIAIASTTYCELQVRFNDSETNKPHFTTGLIGRDNAVARHGIHGLYWLFSIDVQSIWLVDGENTIFLTQPRCTSPFQGIMYDYIRLEGPPL